MRESLRFETDEDIDCPGCGKQIPMQTMICPHCEHTLD